MKKLLLINPVQKKSGYLLSRHTTFPPLGLACLAAVTPGDWDVKILDENFVPCKFETADLVGITAFTSSINRAYDISKMFREAGITVIIGGIHASMVTEEVLDHADSVVIGEGEEIWPGILEDFKSGSLKRRYRAEIIDIGHSFPAPRRDLLDKRYIWNSVQTSRGCPFDCTFCSVTRYQGSNFRQRNVDEVLEELESIPGKHIAFVDDNLIGYSEESRWRAKELFRGMINRKLNKSWWMQTSINAVSDPEVLSLAARAGCFIAFVGFETIDETGLKEMHKGINVKIGVKNYKKVVRAFHRKRIGVMGGFIIGNDWESAGYYRKFSNFLLHSGIDICQIAILTPLPGTSLFDLMVKEGRLTETDFPKDWVKYRLSRIVHSINGIEPEDVYRGDNFIKEKIYTGAGFIFRMIKSFFALRNLRRFLGVVAFNKAMRRSWMQSFYHDSFSHSLPERDGK